MVYNKPNGLANISVAHEYNFITEAEIDKFFEMLNS